MLLDEKLKFMPQPSLLQGCLYAFTKQNFVIMPQIILQQFSVSRHEKTQGLLCLFKHK